MKATLYFDGKRLCDANLTVIAEPHDGMVALPVGRAMVVTVADPDAEPEPEPDPGAVPAPLLVALATDNRVRWPLVVERNDSIGLRGGWCVKFSDDRPRLMLQLDDAIEGHRHNLADYFGCYLCGASFEDSFECFHLGRQIPMYGPGNSYRRFALCDHCATEHNVGAAEFAPELKQLFDRLMLVRVRQFQEAFKPKLRTP